jgi:prevent-host-death family protein
MKFVSISELKNETSDVVHQVERGGSIIVVRHGKPCAAVIRITGDDLDQLLFEDSAIVKRAVAEGLDDLRHKRYVTLKDYLRGKRSS